MRNAPPNQAHATNTRHHIAGSRIRYAALDTYDSDLPPLVETWVGRDQELDLLNDISNGVVTITGIGGQGKSALAAIFLKNLREQSATFSGIGEIAENKLIASGSN